jgi:hypothetical protein
MAGTSVAKKFSQMNSTPSRIGYLAGIAAFISAAAYCFVQLLQIGGALHFPWDESLIYATSLCIVVPFMLQMLSLHYLTPQKKQIWTHASLVFSIVYAVFVTANYVVQLATVIPAKLVGTSAAIRVLEQTPHSMFWDYDAIGYIFMGLATLFAIPALEKNGFEGWVRWWLLAHSVVTPLIAFVYFYPTFSQTLILLALPWAVTAPFFMLQLARLLKYKEVPTN